MTTSNTSNDKPGISAPSLPSQIKELVLLALVFIIVVSSIGFGFFAIAKGNQATPFSLTDPLSSNTTGRWQQSAECVFKGGSYHVLAQHANGTLFCKTNKFSFDNVAIRVDVSLIAGSAAGLVFRFNKQHDGSYFYVFEITNQGGFLLLKYAGSSGPNASTTFLAQSPQTRAIAPGSQKNTLLVIARDNDFQLYINSTRVGEGQDLDSALSSGLIGFAVKTTAPATHGDASFSNLTVFPLAA